MTSRSSVFTGVNSSPPVVRDTLPYRPYSPETASRTGARRRSDRAVSVSPLPMGAVRCCPIAAAGKAAPNGKTLRSGKTGKTADSVRSVMVIF